MFTNFITFLLLPSSKNKLYYTARIYGNLKELELPTRICPVTGKELLVTSFPLHIHYVHKVFGKRVKPGSKHSALWLHTVAEESEHGYSENSLQAVTPL
jgi:hypothetical protein